MEIRKNESLLGRFSIGTQEEARDSKRVNWKSKNGFFRNLLRFVTKAKINDVIIDNLRRKEVKGKSKKYSEKMKNFSLGKIVKNRPKTLRALYNKKKRTKVNKGKRKIGSPVSIKITKPGMNQVKVERSEPLKKSKSKAQKAKKLRNRKISKSPLKIRKNETCLRHENKPLRCHTELKAKRDCSGDRKNSKLDSILNLKFLKFTDTTKLDLKKLKFNKNQNSLKKNSLKKSPFNKKPLIKKSWNTGKDHYQRVQKSYQYTGCRARARTRHDSLEKRKKSELIGSFNGSFVNLVGHSPNRMNLVNQQFPMAMMPRMLAAPFRPRRMGNFW